MDVLVNSFDCKPDIIAVTEVKPKNLKDQTLKTAELQLQGYNIFCHGLDDVNERGVLFYVISEIDASLVNVPATFREALFITVSGLGVHKKVLIGNVYRSPSSSQDNDIELNNMLKFIEANFKMPKLLVGDFNFPSIDWYPCSEFGASAKVDGLADNEMRFVNSVRENFFSQHVFQPTRQRGKDMPHVLDLVLSSGDFVSEVVHLSPLGMSDHCVLTFECELQVQQGSKAVKYKLDRGDYVQLKDSLEIDWDTFLDPSNSSVNEMWDKFKSLLVDGMNKYIPMGGIKNIGVKKHFQPFTKDLQALVHRKHRLWTRWISSRDDNVHKQYNIIRNKVKNEVKKLIKLEQEKISAECKTNPKRFWQYVNRKTKSRSNVADLRWIDSCGIDNLAESDTDKANALENFFSSVFTVEDEHPFDKLPSQLTDQGKAMMDLAITVHDVLSKLSRLKIDKSPGLDSIHPRVLFEARDVIAYPLWLIFKESLSAGEIPNDWKLAEVTAIFKKGLKSDRGNYRPVSLTSVCCKILESLVRDHIMDYLLGNKLLSTKQFGFIKGRSTALQLLCVLDNWTDSIEQGGQIDAIYTDFEKAFDKVPHKRLLSKLYAYGFNKMIINWIKEFLTDRKHRVKVNTKHSGWGKVTSGIPQGSVLGPVLFLIYINDLIDNCGKQVDTYLFADDAKIFRHIKHTSDHELLQNGIDALQEWSDRWLLKLNVRKCKVVSFGRNVDKSHCYNMSRNITVATLARDNQITDLGVLIDEKLNFKDHINAKINKAYAMIGLIKRNFKHLSIKGFILLYKSMVRSHLDYCSSVWSPYRKGDIELLEKVQKRATKFLPALKHMTYSERLRACNLPTLHYRRIRGDMIETYKILTGKYDISEVSLFALDLTSVTRGNNMKLHKTRAKYDLKKYYFTHRVVNVWNSLPNDVVNAESVNSFKSRLDKFWSNQELLYDFKTEIKGTGSRSEVIVNN